MTPRNVFAISTKAGSGNDLRSSALHKINVHLKITTTLHGARKLIPAYALNLSDSGLSAFIPAELPPGHTVEIEFSLPRSQNVLARAVVRAINRFHYGLEFIKLEDAVKEQLRALALTCEQTA